MNRKLSLGGPEPSLWAVIGLVCLVFASGVIAQRGRVDDESSPGIVRTPQPGPAVADLGILKFDSPDPVNAGEILTYSITVTNSGPFDATSVQVNDTLPDGVTPSGVVIANLGTLLANTSTNFSFQVSVDADTLGILTNTATVSSSVVDTNSSNNLATELTTVSSTADLGILKFDSPDPVNAGEILTYSITVTNSGPSDATSVQVNDTLPDGVTPSGVVIANLGTLLANTSTNFSFQVSVDADTLGVLTNTATVSSSSSDTNSSNNLVTELTTVSSAADLGILKFDSPDPVTAGEVLTYSITVTNSGPSDAASVQVTDTLPDGVTPSGVVIANLGTLPANASTNFSFQVSVDADTLGVLTNTATVSSSSSDLNAGNNLVTELTTVAGMADLGILKGDSPDPVIAGEVLTYDITVTNSGPSDATSVQVLDTLPSDVTPSGIVIANLGTLPANAATNFSFQVTVDPDAGSVLTNTATVSSATADGNAANDSDTELTTVDFMADLGITKSDSPDPVMGGQMLTYDITVTNSGPSDATSVQVLDTLPDGVTPGGVVVANLGTLPANASTNFNFQVTVDALTLGDITNTATVSTAVIDPNGGNDTAVEVTRVAGCGDMIVDPGEDCDDGNMTDGDGCSATCMDEPFAVSVVSARGDADQEVGFSVDYTFRITNLGTDPDVYDLVAGGVYFDTLSGASTGTLNNGEFEDVTVTATVPCNAPLGAAEALSLTVTSQGQASVVEADMFDITPVDNHAGFSDGYFYANELSACAPSKPTFAWIDISGTGTDVIGSLGEDSLIGPFPIGFNFDFFGNIYTEFFISSNGWISFDGTDPGAVLSSDNTALPEVMAPNDLIAAFWNDMDPTNPAPGGSHVYVGAAPDGSMVITFERLPELGADADGWITFQVVLRDNGNVLIQNMDNGPSIDLLGSSVGLEDDTGTLGVQYHLNGAGGVLFSSPLAIEFGTDENDVPVELLELRVE